MSENKIINKVNKVIAESYKSVVDADWNGLELHIKRYLSLEEMMMSVNNVVLTCFAPETGEYLPEIKDFATRCCVLENYAGLALPSSLNEKYKIVYGCDIVPFVMQHIDKNQFNAMLSSINKKIEHKAQSNIEAINKQMNEIISGFSELEENVSKVFKDIDNGTITKIAEAIADGNFDESKLVKAFTEEANQTSELKIEHG